MKGQISWWVLAFSGVLALLGLFAGCALYFFPSLFVTDVDVHASGVTYLLQSWAARQIALGAIIGFAAVKRSAPMLVTALLAYTIVQGQDVVIESYRGSFGQAIAALTTGCLAVAMMAALRTKRA